MVEVVVARLGIDSGTNSYVVVLRERDGRRLLPIWIRKTEAEAIVEEMNGVTHPRPLTHDLCKALIVGLGGTLRRVQVVRVEQNTYFAELHIEQRGELVQVDARPSDSIAIALRLDAPIFAAEELLAPPDDEAEGDGGSGGGSPDAPPSSPRPPSRGRRAPMDADQLKAYLENLRPEDFGKFRP